MDRESLSKYGWVVILIIILVILLSVATPVAGMIRTSVKNIVTTIDDTLPEDMQAEWPITLDEIEADPHMFAIGATKPEYVIAKFNDNYTSVTIFNNGSNADGKIKEFLGKGPGEITEDDVNNYAEIRNIIFTQYFGMTEDEVRNAYSYSELSAILREASNVALNGFDVMRFLNNPELEKQLMIDAVADGILNSEGDSLVTEQEFFAWEDQWLKSKSNGILGINADGNLLINYDESLMAKYIERETNGVYTYDPDYQSYKLNLPPINEIISTMDLRSPLTQYADTLKSVTFKDTQSCTYSSTSSNDLKSLFAGCVNIETLTCSKYGVLLGDQSENLTGLKRVTCSVGTYGTLPTYEEAIVVDTPIASTVDTTHWNYYTGLPWCYAKKITFNAQSAPKRFGGFRNNNVTEQIVFSNNTIDIGEYAFANYRAVTNIDFGSSIKTIGDYAFQYASELKDINLPNSVTSIGAETFAWCDNAITLSLSSNLKTIGTGVFRNCGKIESVELPDSLTIISEEAFSGCSSLSSVSFGNNTKDIQDRAFASCSTLNNVMIPNSVTNIGFRAFEYCTTLHDITLSENAKSLDFTFYECTSLETIDISNVEYLREAFCNCTALREIAVPYNCVYIYRPFTNCTSLSDATLYYNLEERPMSGIFGGENYQWVTSSGSYTSQVLAPYTELNVHVNEGQESELSLTMLSSGYRSLYFDEFITDIIVSENTTALKNDSFYVTNINVPYSIGFARYKIRVVENSDAELHFTNLRTVTIPDSVTSIEENTFIKYPDVTIRCNPGSYAYEYATAHGINVQPID